MNKFLLVFLSVFIVSGCATKRYTLAVPLSDAESELLDCNGLALEMIRADQVELQINETGKADFRTAIGVLGDFGIGNQMAKDEAREALAIRRTAIRSAQLKKGCIGLEQIQKDITSGEEAVLDEEESMPDEQP